MKRLSLLLACCILCTILPVKAGAANLEVAGKSALLMDMTTGTVLFEYNAHERLAPASVTKVMTMLLIMEAIDSGRISWNDAVTTSEAAAAKGGSQIYLKVVETMLVTDMVKSIAVSSANDCACAMAEHIAGSEQAFVEMMNSRAKELGMNDTHFVNCTGLDDGEDAAAHLTSAYDIALMSRELMKNHPDIQKFTTIWMDTVRDGAFGLANTNKLVRFYPGATGLKTGFTANAGYCLSATAQRDAMGLIAVVMGAKTSQDRFAACKQMLDYGFANYALVRPEMPSSSVVPVTLGKSGTVTAVPGADTQLLVEKQQHGQITTEMTLEESVTAPVSKGQKLGLLTVKCGDQILARVNMVAEHGVERLQWADVLIMALRKLTMSAEV
jgi:D-alanyl-D-alanine carboxypeptidase (penicillin-binding protein 5/6)